MQLQTGTEAEESKQVTELTFHFRSTGSYQIDIVLEAEDFNSFSLLLPKTNESDEPPYLGWSLPGAPLFVEVTENKKDEKVATAVSTVTRKWCTMDELLQDDAGERIVTGHYTQYTPVPASDLHLNPIHATPQQGYENGYERLGLCTEWVHDKCSMLPMDEFDAPAPATIGRALQACTKEAEIERINLILIGDSVTDAVYHQLRDELKVMGDGKIALYFISTSEGLSIRNKIIRSELANIQEKPGRHIIFFNAGPHDTNKYCVKAWKRWRQNNVEGLLKHGNCLDLYRYNFQQLVNTIGNYKAALKVFRTTNAGWMRWGNFGFGWGLGYCQNFIDSPQTVSIFNAVAIDIVIESNRYQGGIDIKVLDYFALSYPRPDNTEVHWPDNKVGNHLVHPGHSVLSILTRKMLMMVMWNTCSATLENWTG